MPRPLDPSAYGPLTIRLTARARRLVGDPDTAADLAQEALLRLWRHSCTHGGPEASEPFAMTILRNLAISHWRARRATDPLDDEIGAVPSAAHVSLALRDVAAAIDRLPPAQARLIGLVAQGVTSPAELSRRTGVPQGTVMSRLARARATLRRDLALEHGSADLLERD